MSESGTTTTPDVGPGADPPTEEIFVEGGGTDDDEWPARGPRRGVRMSIPTVALLALLIAAGGIWGGAALQRGQGTSSATSSAASTFASLFGGRGATATGGITGAAGAPDAATSGTVTEVSGSTLYVTDASGGLVKVTVAPSVTVTRNAKTSVGSLQVGDTVVVRGTKAGNGSVTATSVTGTGAGVTAGFGFGGASPTGTGGG